MYNSNMIRDLNDYRPLSKQTVPRELLLKQLVEKQKRCVEGSKDWYKQQNLINQLIADNFLAYVNGNI
jgi:hypothetical protein